MLGATAHHVKTCKPCNQLGSCYCDPHACKDLLSRLKCTNVDGIDGNFLRQKGEASIGAAGGTHERDDTSVKRVVAPRNAEEMRSLKFALIQMGIEVGAWVHDSKEKGQVYNVTAVTDENVKMKLWSNGELKDDVKVMSCTAALKQLKIAEKKQTKVETTWKPVHETTMWKYECQKARVMEAMGKLQVPFYADVAQHLQVYKNPNAIQVTKTFAKGELVIQSAFAFLPKRHPSICQPIFADPTHVSC